MNAAVKPRPMSGAPSGPLSGIRVVEAGQLLAGPFVGSRLADFGAEVIKVEVAGRGRPDARMGPPPL